MCRASWSRILGKRSGLQQKHRIASITKCKGPPHPLPPFGGEGGLDEQRGTISRNTRFSLKTRDPDSMYRTSSYLASPGFGVSRAPRCAWILRPQDPLTIDNTRLELQAAGPPLIVTDRNCRCAFGAG